jgi:hypothetical protein
MGLVEGAPHSDVTYKIIGLAMAGYNDLVLGIVRWYTIVR